jgi:hypothetical protein
VIAHPAGRIPDLGHTQIHIGRELPVELDLAGARGRPRLPGGEIKEAEADRFLQLVGPVTGEEHRRRVRFCDLSP